MTTREFIEKCVRTIEEGGTMKKKLNSSVMVDGNVIYSYGYHYPLLFRIEDKDGRVVWVCNSGGYSATTSKHIAWAWRSADIDVKIGGISGFFSRAVDKAMVIEALRKELEEVEKTMQNKKSTETYVYKQLKGRQHRLYLSLERLIPLA
jgi:hypothetical protein